MSKCILRMVVVIFTAFLIGCVPEKVKQESLTDKVPKSSASSVMSVEKRQAKIDTDIDIISDALEVYKKDHGVYPTDQEGLHALLSARTSEPNQTYIATLPKTPGGGDYLYKTSEIWLIYRERTQPIGLGWKWSDRNQSWQRTDNGYLIQVSEPDGMISSIPKKQFGPLPSGVYFAPAGGFR